MLEQQKNIYRPHVLAFLNTVKLLPQHLIFMLNIVIYKDYRHLNFKILDIILTKITPATNSLKPENCFSLEQPISCQNKPQSFNASIL